MAYDFTKFKTESKEIEEWLRKECQSIRTGQAAPSILDGVMVEAYGQSMPIKQVAGITIEDARSIRISPWDTSVTKAIEKGIMVADLGVSVSSDDKGVRVSFPELTADRRVTLLKLAKGKLEESRATLRALRNVTMTDIENKEKEGGMGEDEKNRYKTELQKMVDATNAVLEEVLNKKEKEISL
ncbi:MAG: ribosome recycling factor [bacterium]